GPKMAGQGWRMLMECLAAGRSISLPSSGTGYAKLAARATGAYARVRSQFKTPIGKCEGIEEALARIGGNLYVMDAARTMTARAGDLKSFDAALFGHVRHVISNETRAFLMAITGSRFVSVSPKAAPRTRRYYRQLTRISAAFAYAADISMLVLGGSLKRRESI